MNDRPTPKEQILNPIYDGPVEVDGFGKAHPVGHTGELRRTKEENRELRARVVELEAVAKAAVASVRNPAWAGICDEDVALEQALIKAKLI